MKELLETEKKKIPQAALPEEWSDLRLADFLHCEGKGHCGYIGCVVQASEWPQGNLQGLELFKLGVTDR